MAMTGDIPIREDSPSPIKPPVPSSHVFDAEQHESPAAQQLAALNKKDARKEGKSSRLRRAFSFGSAAELRKASAENSRQHAANNDRSKLRKDQYKDVEEAQQAAIAQRQEAGGLGEGIYSHQGQFFTGSTDNLSVSSTASSASIMLRKMGQGVKRSTRSLVGLFRPKSVTGVSTDEASTEPPTAQVTRVTVEAERERVNVNANPHDQPGGETGFPRLERNSIDAAAEVSLPDMIAAERSSDIRGRPSFHSGDRERAKVLAAVKKGILKRNGTGSEHSSPVVRPVDATKSADFVLPNIPRYTDSPASSAPSTPTSDPRGSNHRRTDSVTIEGEDYFMSVAKFTAEAQSKSLPGTPHSLVRNITFSPRIQFHDTWTANDYDRRGEIATCNRLTPMLAQQIKEELNTFKMVRLILFVAPNSADAADRKWKSMNPPRSTHTSFSSPTSLHVSLSVLLGEIYPPGKPIHHPISRLHGTHETFFFILSTCAFCGSVSS